MHGALRASKLEEGAVQGDRVRCQLALSSLGLRALGVWGAGFGAFGRRVLGLGRVSSCRWRIGLQALFRLIDRRLLAQPPPLIRIIFGIPIQAVEEGCLLEQSGVYINSCRR